MRLGLTGRVAVVAASTKGLGLATAQALAAEGAQVVVNGRDPERVAAAAAAVPGAISVPGDVTDADVPARLVQAALDRWGRIDIVVGNAGGPPSRPTP